MRQPTLSVASTVLPVGWDTKLNEKNKHKQASFLCFPVAEDTMGPAVPNPAAMISPTKMTVPSNCGSKQTLQFLHCLFWVFDKNNEKSN